MDVDSGARDALTSLLTDARRLTRARAGSVYVRDAHYLHFIAAQNDDLAAAIGEAETARLVTRTPLRWSERSIASYVALTRAAVNIADVYRIPPDKPYSFNPRLDFETGFHTTSMLVVPLRSAVGAVYGVLQLINATDDGGSVVPFARDAERMVETLAAGAAA